MNTMISLLSLALAAAAPRVAVLPLVPDHGADPREGWALSVKLMGELDPAWKVVAVSWSDLAQVMDEHQLDKRAVREPATLRRVGKALGVDAVVAGSFKEGEKHSLAKPVLVEVASGKVRPAAERTIRRDLKVPPPPLEVAPPVLDPEASLSVGARDYDACDGAQDRVDSLEARILELKARYWALQLSRGVSYSTLKFNPGSTITDPDLKRRFYEKMKEWMAQPLIPELTPHEVVEFARDDTAAFELARECGIL